MATEPARQRQCRSIPPNLCARALRLKSTPCATISRPPSARCAPPRPSRRWRSSSWRSASAPARRSSRSSTRSSCAGCRSTSTIGSSRSASARPPGPSPDPNRDPQALSSVAPQNYMDWAAQQQVFESIAAIAGGAFTLREPGAEPEDLRGAARDRRVLRRAARRAGDRAAVHGRERGRRPAPRRRPQRRAVAPPLRRRSRRSSARRFRSKAAAYEVVGVMPAGLRVSGRRGAPDRALGAVRRPAGRAHPQSAARAASTFRAIARLKPGVSLEQAQAKMDQIAAALADDAPGVEQGQPGRRAAAARSHRRRAHQVVDADAARRRRHRAADRLRERRQPAARARERRASARSASAPRSAPADGG